MFVGNGSKGGGQEPEVSLRVVAVTTAQHADDLRVRRGYAGAVWALPG